MGYSTDFDGEFKLNTPLKPKMKKYLKLFSDTRRMGRNQEGYGVEGEFYVFGSGSFGQGNDPDIIDFNTPPKTQPSLWCKWEPNEEGTAILWNYAEKFYHYNEWLVYLITKILAPNGYVLNGEVTWQGEDMDDRGKIVVKDNKVFIYLLQKSGYVLQGELKPEEVKCSTLGKQPDGEWGYTHHGIVPELVLILPEDGKDLTGGTKLLEA